MSNYGNKNPVGNELQPHCQLEKSYESVLKTGIVIRIHMAIDVSGCTPKNTEKALSEFAKCSHNFYLETGRQLNNTP